MKRADAEVEGLAEEEARSRRELPRPNVDTTIPSLVEALSHTKVHEEDVKAVQNVALRPELWRYKGEGAAHLVLEFNDEAEEEREEEHTTTDKVSLLKGHVLRVMKRQNTNRHSNANSNNIPPHELHIPAEGLLWFQGKPLEVHNYELKEFAFIANVMAPLLGERFVHSGIPLQVNPEFLSTLSQRINGDRPDHRKKEADVDDSSTFAFILPDLSVFPRINKLSAPSICVEIKPKWGFLPSSPLIRQGHSIKGRVCRYCMLQRYKLKTGKISQISAYCPLDLFSYDEKRVERALWDMLSVPQNNIKIFVDGTLRYTGSLGGAKRHFTLEELELALRPTLASEGDKKDNNNKHRCISKLVRIVTSILLKERLLSDLRAVQEMDNLDVEAIHFLHKKLCHVGLDSLANEWDETTLKVFEGDSESRQEFVEKLQQGKLHRDDYINAIRDFLISATAKDCSIMITIQPSSPTDFSLSSSCSSSPSPISVLAIDNEDYKYRIALVDLDPKPVSNIPFWYALDQKIVENFLRELRQGTLAPPLPHCLARSQDTEQP